MKSGEFRDMTDEELLNKLEDLERNLFNLKVQHATGQLDSTARIRLSRRDLARAKTIIKERGL